MQARYFAPLEETKTVEDRFHDCTGSKRWQRILHVYGLSRGEGQTLHFFKQGQDGALIPLLQRSMEHNGRRQEVVIKKYAKSILEEGLVSLVSGQPIAIQADTPDHYFMLAGASRCEALYVAHAMNPKNELVMHAVANGFKGALVLRKDTPGDVLAWVKNKHNAFHTGSQTSFIELMAMVPEVEEKWKAHKRLKRISVDSTPKTGPFRYHALYSQFVLTKFDGLFASFNHYGLSKAFYHAATKLGVWDLFREHVESRCNFFSKECDPPAIAGLCNLVTNTAVFFPGGNAKHGAADIYFLGAAEVLCAPGFAGPGV